MISKYSKNILDVKQNFSDSMIVSSLLTVINCQVEKLAYISRSKTV